MTRGELLCNPGDIRRTSTVWVGQSADQPDTKYVKFASAEYGIRAIAVILGNYAKSKIQTVAGAITRWAPPSENDTAAYIKHVTALCACSPGTPFARILPQFIAALITHEQGQCIYDQATIAAGIALAQEKPVSTDVQPTTMASVINHPMTQKAITGSAVAGFIASELAKFNVYDMTGAETLALGVLLSIVMHRLFPQGLPTD